MRTTEEIFEEYHLVSVMIAICVQLGGKPPDYTILNQLYKEFQNKKNNRWTTRLARFTRRIATWVSNLGIPYHRR